MNFLNKIHTQSRKHLKKGDQAWSYLRSRGVSDDQIRSYGLGWFPPEQWPPWVEPGESNAADHYLKWSGRGVKLKGKLFIPLHDTANNLVGFKLRTPDEEQKDYSVYRLESAKKHAVFFGFRQAMRAIWETKEVFLVEGPFDLFPMARIRPQSISVGTSRLMGRQREFVRRFVDKVFFAFDADEQGKAGYEQFCKNHESEFERVHRIQFDANDVNDVWRRGGDERLRREVELSVDPLGYKPR